jgi:hypothetical protein
MTDAVGLEELGVIAAMVEPRIDHAPVDLVGSTSTAAVSFGTETAVKSMIRALAAVAAAVAV